MCLLIATIVAGLAIKFSNFINKNNKWLYLFSVVLSVVSIFLGTKSPVTQGSIPLALFTLVMFIGVLNENKNYTKNLLSVRAELSIIASILLLPHVILLSPYLYSNNIGISENILTTALYLMGIVAFIIIIPLFVTSFKPEEMKKKSPKWKKLQRLSYLVYLLIFGHLIVVALYNNEKTFILYALTIIAYGILRILKHIKNK